MAWSFHLEASSSNASHGSSSGSGFFQLIKRNAAEFAIDGGNGGLNGQNVQLYHSSTRSQNLQWRITPVN